MQRTFNQRQPQPVPAPRRQHGSLTATARLTLATAHGRRTLRANTKSKMDIPEGGGWHRERSLLEWGPGRAARAGGAASPRGSSSASPRASPTPARQHPPPAPLSWALISPRRAIQLRVARSSLHLRVRVVLSGLARSEVAFECSSLSPLHSRYSYWALLQALVAWNLNLVDGGRAMNIQSSMI